MKVLQNSAIATGDSQKSVRQRLYDGYRSHQGSTDADYEFRQRAPYLRRLIRNHYPEDRTASMLDLGCGAGSLLRCLNEAGYQHIAGIDTSAEQVAVARKSGLDVSHADIISFLERADAESYAVITSFDVLEHLEKPEVLQLADEIHRTLQPNGRWIIHTANAEGIFGNRIRHADLTHEQAFTRESIAQLSRAARFPSCECFEDQPVIHGLASLLRWVVWKIGRTLVGIYFTAETGERAGQAIFSQNLLAVVRK